jgi:hypothetical protein
MKITIAVCFIITLLFAALGMLAASKETNPDDYSSAFAFIAAIGMFIITATLTGCYALYQLFVS